MGNTKVEPGQGRVFRAPRRPNPNLILDRPRVVDLIESCSLSALCVVQGPRASGKTVALQQWSRTSSKHTVWIVLEETESTIEHFWRHLAAAISEGRNHEPQLIDVPRLLADPVRYLAAELAGSAPLTVIVDNYHLIQGRGVEKILIRLLDKTPELSLVIAPRLPLDIERLQLSLNLEIQTVDAGDLAFTPAEAAAFHAGTALHAVSGELNDYFKGIPNGHKAAQLVAYEPLPPTAMLAKHIISRATDLVKREILELGDSVLTPEMTRLLTLILPLDRFDHALLDLLAPGEDLQPPITWLLENNLLSVSNTTHGIQYYFEPITGDACASILAPEIAASRRQVLDTAAAFEISRGEVAQGFIYAIANQDYRLATTALLQSGVSLFADRGSVLHRTLPRIPRTDLIKHPLLAVSLGIIYYADKQTHVRGLEYFTLVLTATEQAGKTASIIERFAMYLARTMALRLTGQIRLAAASARTALKNFNELSLADRDSLHTFESIALGQWSLTLILAGDYKSAEESLQQSLAAHGSLDSPHTLFFTLALLAYRHAVDGDLQVAATYVQMAVELPLNIADVEFHQQTPLAMARALIELGQLNPEAAAEHLQSSMEHIDTSEFWGQLRVIEARIDLLRGLAGVALARLELVTANKRSLPAISPVDNAALSLVRSKLLLAGKNASGPSMP